MGAGVGGVAEMGEVDGAEGRKVVVAAPEERGMGPGYR